MRQLADGEREKERKRKRERGDKFLNLYCLVAAAAVPQKMKEKREKKQVIKYDHSLYLAFILLIKCQLAQNGRILLMIMLIIIDMNKIFSLYKKTQQR